MTDVISLSLRKCNFSTFRLSFVERLRLAIKLVPTVCFFMDICMGNRKWQWIPCWLLRAQKSIARNRFRQAGNRFLGSLTGLQIRALIIASFSPLCHMFPMFSSKLFVSTFLDQLPVNCVSLLFILRKCSFHSIIIPQNRLFADFKG